MATILVIDDDPFVARTITAILERRGHQVAAAGDGAEAVARLRGSTADLVITDLLMPEQEGIETIRQLRRRSLALPILAIAGGGRWGTPGLLEAAKLAGTTDGLAKPFGETQLLGKVAALLRCPE